MPALIPLLITLLIVGVVVYVIFWAMRYSGRNRADPEGRYGSDCRCGCDLGAVILRPRRTTLATLRAIAQQARAHGR